jgi:hypothetical protein
MQDKHNFIITLNVTKVGNCILTELTKRLMLKKLLFVLAVIMNFRHHLRCYLESSPLGFFSTCVEVLLSINLKVSVECDTDQLSMLMQKYLQGI